MRRGMTLFEVLIALAIASVVFAAVFLIYRAATATALHQREGERVVFAPAVALDAIQTDIAGLVPGTLDQACTLKLATDSKSAAPRSEITLCSWRTITRDEPWTTTEKIIWRIEGDPGRTRLARIAVPLAGPRSATPATNYFLPGIAAFRLLLNDGKVWHDNWPPDSDSRKNAQPRSLRIELAMDSASRGAAWTTDYAIPLGSFVTSTIPREAAAPAAAPRTRTR